MFLHYWYPRIGWREKNKDAIIFMQTKTKVSLCFSLETILNQSIDNDHPVISKLWEPWPSSMIYLEHMMSIAMVTTFPGLRG